MNDDKVKNLMITMISLWQELYLDNHVDENDYMSITMSKWFMPHCTYELY